MTAFSDLSAAVVAKLKEAPALAGGRVYRGAAWPLPVDQQSMIFARPTSSDAEYVGLGGPVDWTTLFEVEIRARTVPDSEAPDETVDALIGDVFQRMAALTSSAVSNVVPALNVRWDYSDSDVNVISVTVTMQIVHRTQSSTLAAWS